jgi:hypothetical protein
MTKDEALDLALEALEFIPESGSMLGAHAEGKRVKAITAIKQALALDKKAENARELGLDYEPVGLIDRLKNPEQHYEFTDPKKANAVLMSLCQEAADALAAQPAPTVQEPVAWVLLREDEDGFEPIQFYGGKEKPETAAGELKPRFTLRPVCFADTTPPAQPAVPDAFGTREGEHPQYIQGWNDCRAEMLKGMK